MFCTKCGKEIEAGAQFCAGCGVGSQPAGTNQNFNHVSADLGPKKTNWYAWLSLAFIIGGIVAYSFNYLASLVLDGVAVGLAIFAIYVAIKKLNGSGKIFGIICLVIGIFMLFASMSAYFEWVDVSGL